MSDNWTVKKPVVRSARALVTAQHLAAAEVGAGVLDEGGNAIDAAIATSLALAVLEPWMSGLGGGGYMLVAKAGGGPVDVIDFAMVAPAGLDPAAYPLGEGADQDLFGWPAVVDQRNVHGPLSIAVPGQAAGLQLAFESYASRPWAELCAPAISLAEAGLPVSWSNSLRIATAAADLQRFAEARAVYLPNDLPPVPPPDGTTPHLPLGQLSATLRRLADAGPSDLLTGQLAQMMTEDVQAAGGTLSLDDLAAYRAQKTEALVIDHGAAKVHTPGGLTAGPTLRHALELIQGEIADGPPGPGCYAAWAAALFAAYEHRLSALGHASASPDPTCTTHLCVVDGAGTMVSLTQTLLSVFGSKIISPQTGILLNNGIMWFDPRPGGPNAIAPGKRPLSNMCPVIATRDGTPWFALGASGGRKILPAVLQIASMLIDCGLDLETAFHTARIDVSGGPSLAADRRLSTDILSALQAQFPVKQVDHTVYPNLFACPSAVLHDPATGDRLGMTDITHPLAGAAVSR